MPATVGAEEKRGDEFSEVRNLTLEAHSTSADFVKPLPRSPPSQHADFTHSDTLHPKHFHDKGITLTPGNCVVQDGHVITVRLADHGLSDLDLRLFLTWLGRRIPSMFAAAGEIVLSMRLQLAGNSISDLGVSALVSTLLSHRRICSVEQLDLSCNKISDSGAEFITTLLSTTTQPIHTVLLGYNRITSTGALILLEAVLEDHRYPCIDWDSRRCTPLWLNLVGNHFNPDYVVESLRNIYGNTPLWCLAADRMMCDETRCVYSQGLHTASASVRVHLVDFDIQFRHVNSYHYLSSEDNSEEASTDGSSIYSEHSGHEEADSSPLTIFLDSSAIEKMITTEDHATFTFTNLLKRCTVVPSERTHRAVRTRTSDGDNEAEAIVLCIMDKVLDHFLTSETGVAGNTLSIPERFSRRQTTLSLIQRCVRQGSVKLFSLNSIDKPDSVSQMAETFATDGPAAQVVCEVAAQFNSSKRLQGNVILVSEDIATINFAKSNSLPAILWSVISESLFESEQESASHSAWTSWHLRSCIGHKHVDDNNSFQTPEEIVNNLHPPAQTSTVNTIPDLQSAITTAIASLEKLAAQAEKMNDALELIEAIAEQESETLESNQGHGSHSHLMDVLSQIRFHSQTRPVREELSETVQQCDVQMQVMELLLSRLAESQTSPDGAI